MKPSAGVTAVAIVALIGGIATSDKDRRGLASAQTAQPRAGGLVLLTVFTIFAFGVLSLVLHDEMMRGERAAFAVATFIRSYWLVRIVVDFTYYSNEDWPKGTAFGVGHFLLTALFAYLSTSYPGLSLWHFLKT